MPERTNERPFQKDKIKNKAVEVEEQEDRISDESKDEDEGSRQFGAKPDEENTPQ